MPTGGYPEKRPRHDGGMRQIHTTVTPEAGVLRNSGVLHLNSDGLSCIEVCSAGNYDAFKSRACSLPVKSAARKKELKELSTINSTLIFYEAPQRIEETLTDMLEVLGDRKIAVARELTKKFEETLRTTISNALEIYKENGVPKGEFVLVVSAPEKTEAVNEETLTALLKQALESASLKDAVARIVAETGLNKKTVYEKALEIKNGGI